MIYFGSTSPAMAEALDHLEADGNHVNALRVRAFPFAQAVEDFIHEHDKVFVVEQNRDAQLRTMLMNEFTLDAAQARARPALRRHADHGALHRRRHRQEARPAQGRPVREGRVMTYIAKPKLHHPSLVKNKAGFTRRDYEGAVSTLCAGCGHDSISAAIIQACYELDILPHQVAKLSGIGCSSKTPTYFVGASHGFNTVHGRMPSVMTGANLANSDLIYMGVSGDGDSASIGLGQFAHIMRRGVNMTYIVMNNGVYGLTKGQFSATADKGSISKKGVGQLRRIDRPGVARHPDGRHLRRPLLLGRQAPAGAADQGGDGAQGRGLPRRHQPVRGLQQPRRLDQELRLRARAQRGAEPHRLHRGPRGDHHPVRARHGDRRCSSTTARCCACASSARTTIPPTRSRR